MFGWRSSETFIHLWCRSVATVHKCDTPHQLKSSRTASEVTRARHRCCRSCGDAVRSKVLQLGQAPLQVSYVGVAVVAPGAAGAALQELHLHLQLAELKVPALLPQVHAAAHGTVLRAEGR